MKHKRLALLLAILILLGTAGGALAMSSPNYSIDWLASFSSGGNRTQSTNYAANYVIGQTAIATSSGSGQEAQLGFWHGIILEWRSYLPWLEK